ncbi:MAG: YdcF family protein [Actinobacteria bacterium]|nr:YdcF family protein [Actinomycetota bacterium]
MSPAARLRSALAVAMAVVLGCAVYMAACTAQLVRTGSHDNGRIADVIVVMGAAQYDGDPSPLLEARLRHAAELHRAGRAPLVAVTGGKREGDRFTEAEASRAWLIRNGVSDSAILGEDGGRSTWESLAALAPAMRDAGIESAIAVSSRWHVERVVLSLRDLGFVASASPVRIAGYAWFDEDDAAPATYREIVGVALGRVIGFRRLHQITG